MQRRDDRLILAPTDLSNYHNCRHLPRLDLAVTQGLAERPVRYGPVIDELKARGQAHELAYLAHLRASGHTVAEAAQSGTAGVEATLALMRDGAEVIYQAVLSDGHWSGRADFLLRVNTPGAFGDWSYEVTDTKLASETRAGTILQLCVYTHLLAGLQQLRPARMHVVTPGNAYVPVSYRVEDYGAVFRLLARGMDAFVRAPGDTYPEPVAHCDYCAWWSECEQRRRADDHLHYVAGISTAQIETLREMGIARLAQLAALEEVPEPARGSHRALIQVRDQARVQWQSRQAGAPRHELRQPLDAEHGLALLPPPDPHDLFLDFEGNHFADRGVQEYLTGYLAADRDGDYSYTALWASTAAGERQAFETFMDTVTALVAAHPGAHVYHFAPYEPAALKRLMGRYATRETELDRLLRAGVLVDLYALVRRALFAGVERYSIKDLEPLFGYRRQQDLREAALSRRIVEAALEAGEPASEWDAALHRHARIVEAYNREDCESTRRLRDWLETLRDECAGTGHPLPRPAPVAADASDNISDLDRRLQALRDKLLEGVPAEAEARDPAQQARFALAHMMEFHRREDKASWWEYFRVLELDTEDYETERRALAGLEPERVLQAGAAPLQRYRFPPQDADVRRRDDVYDTSGEKLGQVREINFAEGTIDIKKTRASAAADPSHVVFHNHIKADALRESLVRLGESVQQQGFADQAPWRAALALLLRQAPGNGDALQCADETALQAACRLAVSLDGGVLAIQGPPGTGKTYTGAHIVCALRRAGLRVGITAVSHQVIDNLLEGAGEAATAQGMRLRAVHRQEGEYRGPGEVVYVKNYADILRQLDDGGIDVLGATAWAWARKDFTSAVDVLIVDEAGQMSLSNVLATAQAARGLVLLGDPQQLEQPLQCNHPEGSEVSALHHLLDGADTMPPASGLFLDQTYRLHPDIAAFTSEIYYENKLTARPELARQAIVGPTRWAGSGLRYLEVAHRGNQARAPEEVAAIAALVSELTARGNGWRDQDGREHPLTRDDVLVVAPYNAQVNALAEALPKCRVGTVDRFQGQEAAVVIYSMTSSSALDAPRGMEFLYSPNRFNVATSRARALCILVGNRALFDAECKSPRQMKMANGFCRYLELSQAP